MTPVDALPDELLLLVFAGVREPRVVAWERRASVRPLLAVAGVCQRWRRLAKDRWLWKHVWLSCTTAFRWFLPHGFNGLFIFIARNNTDDDYSQRLAQYVSQIARVKSASSPPGVSVTDLKTKWENVPVTLSPVTWVCNFQLRVAPECQTHRLVTLQIPWDPWQQQWLPRLNVLRALRLFVTERIHDIGFIFNSLPSTVEFLSLEFFRLAADPYQSLDAFTGAHLPVLTKLVLKRAELCQDFLTSVAQVATNLNDFEMESCLSRTPSVTYPFPHLQHFTRLGPNASAADGLPKSLSSLSTGYEFNLGKTSVHTLKVNYEWPVETEKGILATRRLKRRMPALATAAVAADVRVLVLLDITDGAWQVVKELMTPWQKVTSYPSTQHMDREDVVLTRGGAREDLRSASYALSPLTLDQKYN